MRSLLLIALGLGACLIAACGAGLPAEEDDSGSQAAPTGCQSVGQAIDFPVDNNAGTIYWASDARVDPTDPTVQSQIKLLFEIPSGQLPTGVSSARIRVAPIRNSLLGTSPHLDTVFQISVLDADFPGFSGTGPTPLTLTLRYDPVKCEIPPETEATLVLGRLDLNTGTWLEVCGDLANTTAAIRQVSCSDGDLSFGVFGVIPKPGGTLDDPNPPVFPTTTFSLTLRDRCDTCPVPSITIEWGPASDGTGSGVLGYWIYVDGVRHTFTSDTAANPTVRFTLQSSANLDTTRQHLYQVQAIDNAGNVSTLFGALRTP